jgi:hypothetical protein
VVARFLLSTAASILIITGFIKVLSLFGSVGCLLLETPCLDQFWYPYAPGRGNRDSCRHPGFILPQWISCLSAHSLDEY